MKRKICVITGTRAEYGLLYWLMKEIQEDSELELQVLVTGMHLSPEFGLTWKQIENDGFPVHKKVEMLLSSDTPVGIAKSMGIGMIWFADAFEELKPDVTVGNNCKIQNNVSVFKGVTLEDGVFCGPSMVFTNVYNPRAERRIRYVRHW